MYHLWHFIWVWFGTALAVIFSAWAFWRGGPAERWGAAIILTGWFLTPLVQDHTRGGTGIGIGVELVDWGVLIGLAIVSFLTRRVWTIFATAFSLNDVASHYAGYLVHIGSFTAVTAMGIWSGYATVVALGIGVWTYDKHRKAEDTNKQR